MEVLATLTPRSSAIAWMRLAERCSVLASLSRFEERVMGSRLSALSVPWCDVMDYRRFSLREAG